MARPREFDESDAIQKATDVFWSLGYEGASLPDLLDGMGLTRGSLYKAFKDKKSLYLRVLDHYETAVVAAGVERLNAVEGPDGEARILALFRSVAETASRGDRRGCLLCTAAAGTEMEDPEIADVVHQGLAILRDGFAGALEKSAAHANLDRDKRQKVANTLLAQYIGLRVLARAGGSSDVVEAAPQQAALILSGQSTLPITP